MVLAQPLTLPQVALARLVRMENLGELHIALKPSAVWRPRAVEHQVDEQIRTELHRAGLMDGRGRLDNDLAASLTLLCRAGAEFYGWINEGDQTRGVLTAATGREALLAVLADGTVSLSQIRPEVLPMALVAQAPEVQPARGEAISVLQSEALASAGGRQRTEAGVGSRPAPADIRTVQKISALPTTGGGELYVAVRDRSGRRRATTMPLRYADTEHGRWLNYMTDTGDGDRRILVSPASPTDLVGRLEQMHRALTG